MSERCEICGEAMPQGEESFRYHGYSGPCPKPALPSPQPYTPHVKLEIRLKELEEKLTLAVEALEFGLIGPIGTFKRMGWFENPPKIQVAQLLIEWEKRTTAALKAIKGEE